MDTIKVVRIHAVLLDNGEVISCGRSLGYEKDFIQHNGKSAIEIMPPIDYENIPK